MYQTMSLRGALAKIRFAIDSRQGLSCILGDVGIGKSSLLRFLQAEYAANENSLTTLLTTGKYPSPFAFLKKIAGISVLDQSVLLWRNWSLSRRF